MTTNGTNLKDIHSLRYEISLQHQKRISTLNRNYDVAVSHLLSQKNFIRSYLDTQYHQELSGLMNISQSPPIPVTNYNDHYCPNSPAININITNRDILTPVILILHLA